MKLRPIILGALLAATGMGIAAPAAHAQDRYREYRQYRYFEGYDRSDRTRRTELRDRLFTDADRVSRAEDRGWISHGDARRLYDRLDAVRDFLAEDRHLTSSEFDRRRDDLRYVEERVRDERRPHHRLFRF